jgi:hypothetical protein
VVASPVQTDGSGGVDPHAEVYGDHEHALRLTADDTNYAAIDANGVLNVVGANGIATSVVGGELTIDGSGLAGPHALLDGDVHTDTVAAECSVGSLVIGTSGGWDELVIGGNGAIMISNGTMAVWTGGVARGDLLVGDATPMWKQLTIGAAGTVLSSNGTDVAWTAGITGTPGTLSVSTTNVGGADHTHAITASYNPGAAASLLKTSSAGALALVKLYINGVAHSLSDFAGDLYVLSTGNLLVTATALIASANTINIGDATHYWGDIYTTGPIYVTDTDNYISNDGSDHLVLNGQSAVYVAVGGTNELAIGSTSVEPIVSADLDLGTNTKRFGKGYFNDTVYAAKFEDITSASFYLDPASTGSALVLAGNIVMSSGKTVDGVDVSEHTHLYDKTTSIGNESSHTHPYTYICDSTSTESGHSHTYFRPNTAGSGDGDYNTKAGTAHTHSLGYTATASGAP